MKKFLFILIPLFIVSCRNTRNTKDNNTEGQLVLIFEAQSKSVFFSGRTFGKIEMTPLETADNCLVGREPIELLLDQNHYFIKDNQQKVIFRFDRAGKFINSIGSRGMGPGEYSGIYDFDIDPAANLVEILAPAGIMLRFDYAGRFISKQNYDESLLSFIKTGVDYWFYTEQIRGNEHLMKISENGKVMAKFLPAKTNWMPYIEKKLARCGEIISCKDIFSQTAYRITDDGPVETTIIDFGKYSIPDRVYNLEMADAFNELENRDYALIFNYLENEQFVYLYFVIIPETDSPNDDYLWLVNKKTGNSVMQKFLPDNPIFKMLGGAKALTADNELVFMADAQMLKACADPFFYNVNGIGESLSDDSNPVIITLNINDF